MLLNDVTIRAGYRLQVTFQNCVVVVVVGSGACEELKCQDLSTVQTCSFFPSDFPHSFVLHRLQSCLDEDITSPVLMLPPG